MTTLFTADQPPATSIFPDGRPMTGDDYLALGVTSPRVELLDGSLLVTPNPTNTHQRIARRLANRLEENADAAHLQIDEAVNVRLTPDRFFIPDVAAYSADVGEVVFVEAEAVALICEILSPSNPTTDKVLKMHLYAEAGIPWYLVVDPTSPALYLYELSGASYKEHSAAQAGEILHLSAPVAAHLDVEALFPGGAGHRD
ncbi:Uma2 family endonuclease [Paractinoplanes abujensis]|uniref:Uma2 family endonuclease n=1 Tax=Paractinoplanes abujensis TaxID=882441 RepID=A0A7W7CY99_9ACTN|nr:Uma2 family endonuclease [Actinoplanes abujensis]MBB4696853.1 Uma2 family endonuclease [Actinoplanes abujensis]